MGHGEIKNSKTTTVWASQLIWRHIERGSKLIAGAASCRSNNAQTCNCKTMILSCELKFEGGRWGPRLSLLTQSEIDVDGGDNLHRFVVQKRRLVEPLLHGIGGGLNQQRMAAYHLKILNRAVLADDGVEPHGSGNTRLLGERGIRRHHLSDQVGRDHLAAHADALGVLLLDFLDGRRRGRGDAYATQNSADYAAGGAAWHAARNAADDTHAGHRGRQIFFLNHGDFFGDDFGCREPAGVELTRGHLDGP